MQNAWSGLKAPAEPSCRPADLHSLIFQIHHRWRFFKNNFYLKSSHRLAKIDNWNNNNKSKFQ